MPDLSDTPPKEVEQEIAEYLDAYEQSLRDGLDAYFDDETEAAETKSVEEEKSQEQKLTDSLWAWLKAPFFKFDPNQPRDETGKWTSDGGGAIGSSGDASKPAAEIAYVSSQRSSGLLRGVSPHKVRIDNWLYKLDEKLRDQSLSAIERQNYQGMTKVLEGYQQSQRGPKRLSNTLDVMYDTNGDLQAAARSNINTVDKVMTLHSAGTTPEAHHDMIDEALWRHRYSVNAVGATPTNDEDRALYESMGFEYAGHKGEMWYKGTTNIEAVMPERLPKPPWSTPQIQAPGVTSEGRRPSLAGPIARAKVENAIRALPRSHAEALKNVPVYLTKNNIHWTKDVRDAAGYYDPRDNSIHLSEIDRYRKLTRGGERTRGLAAKMVNMEKTAIHELGHAYDYLHNREHGKALFGSLTGTMSKPVDPSPEPSAAFKAVSRMTDDEKGRAKYYFSNTREFFAETYALTHGPKIPGGKNLRYFGGIPYDRAMEIFKEAVEVQRTLKLLIGIVIRAIDDDGGQFDVGRIVRNGVFVNDQGLVFIIVNGSPYQIDPIGTPFAALEPGDYDEQQLEDALNKILDEAEADNA